MLAPTATLSTGVVMATAMAVGGAAPLTISVSFSSRRVVIAPMGKEHVSLMVHPARAQEVDVMIAASSLPAPESEAAYEDAVRQYVSALWAEDWDSPEDSVYDTW